jgi:hypothetical protein
MRARFARIAARTQKIVEGHLNESMEDIHQKLDTMGKEIAEMRARVEDPAAGLEDMVDAVLPGLDHLDALLKQIKEAK